MIQGKLQGVREDKILANMVEKRNERSFPEFSLKAAALREWDPSASRSLASVKELQILCVLQGREGGSLGGMGWEWGY